jgi:hypothetical protein
MHKEQAYIETKENTFISFDYANSIEFWFSHKTFTLLFLLTS